MSATDAPTATGIFDRIVCGIDSTPESLEAARQAERLRAAAGTLTLAAVADVDAAVHAGHAMSHVLDEIDEAARGALERAESDIHPTTSQLLAGRPAQCLRDELERTNATLVALGPRGHSRTVGMLVGGVATELLRKAPCSVLFGRDSRLGEFPASVIVGVDGSLESLTAASVAEAVAKRFGSEYLIAAASGGKGVDLPRVETLSPYFVLDPGHPVNALVGLSKQADLLVVGSRGLHGLYALGSVSERVAHLAACSVLVVRTPKEES